MVHNVYDRGSLWTRCREMTKPAHLDPLAENILSRLAGKRDAEEIVLGGYFALQHYLPQYRTTHDIVAWWKSRANPATEKLIRVAMQDVAAAEGFDFKERRFGETISFELTREGKRQFSFQIAIQSVGLEEPQRSAWPPVLIETLSDNVGSKMNALVDRGSPRDFTDILQVVEKGLVAVNQCWNLWASKNRDLSIDTGKQKVTLHLTKLEARRPLDSIANLNERQKCGESS